MPDPPHGYLDDERLRLGCHKLKHDQAELRRRVNASNTVIAGWQCLQCGCWKGVKKSAIQGLDSLPEFDPGIATRNMDAARTQWEKEKVDRVLGWWARYDRYLLTDKWKRKREAVLKRDGKVCRACVTREAIQAHHLSYAHVGDEPLFDLVAVCLECHERITEMDRVRRATGRTPLDGTQA